MEGEADGAGDQGTRPHEHRRPPGPGGRYQFTGRGYLVIIDEQRTHSELRRKEPVDGEPSLDDYRLIGVKLDPAGRIAEVPVVVEPWVVAVVDPDERARRDRPFDPAVGDVIYRQRLPLSTSHV